MAVQFNSTGEGLHRTSGLVSASADYTAMCWWRRTGTPGSYRPVFSMTDATYASYIGVYDGASAQMELDVSNGVGFDLVEGITSWKDNWRHYAYTRTGTTHKWYINGALIGTVSGLDVSGVTLTDLWLGDEGGGNLSNHEVAFFREWSACLSASDVAAEVQATAAVRTANLHTDTPLTADLLDDSGNGHDWTASGTVGFVSNPVIATIPLNTVAQLATALVPGTTQTQDVYHDGVTQTVWYKFENNTADDTVIAVGIWGTLGGTFSSNYWPFANIYPDPLQVEFVNQMFENGSVTLPVPAGMTLYWEVIRSGGGSVNPSLLSIKSVEAETMNAELGDVFISSASIDSWMVDAGYTGLHAGFIDTANSVIRGFLPQFVAGEYGDLLPTSGRILFGDEFGIYPVPASATIDYYLNLYEAPDYVTVLTRVLIPDAPLGTPRIRTHLPTEKFYVLNINTDGGTNSSFYTVDEDGNLSAETTFARNGGTHTFAVNNDETVMYLAKTDGTLKALDMGTLTQSAFVAAVSGYSPRDMLTMPDGSVVVAYLKTSGTRDMFVRRYNAAGATVNTFTPALSTSVTSVDPRLGYSSDDDAFWLFNHLTTAYADVRKVQASTMTQIGYPSITPDGHQGEIPSDDPEMPTTSDSCPIIELRSAMVPDDGDVVIAPGTPGPYVWVHVPVRSS